MGVTLPHGATYFGNFSIDGEAATVDDLAAEGPYFTPSDHPSVQIQGGTTLLVVP